MALDLDIIIIKHVAVMQKAKSTVTCTRHIDRKEPEQIKTGINKWKNVQTLLCGLFCHMCAYNIDSFGNDHRETSITT